MCLRTNVSGYNRVGTIMSGHKRVWAQMCLGTNVSGHKRVHKRVRECVLNTYNLRVKYLDNCM